jgi:hypothetical protein
MHRYAPLTVAVRRGGAAWWLSPARHGHSEKIEDAQGRLADAAEDLSRAGGFAEDWRLPVSSTTPSSSIGTGSRHDAASSLAHGSSLPRRVGDRGTSSPGAPSTPATRSSSTKATVGPRVGSSGRTGSTGYPSFTSKAEGAGLSRTTRCSGGRRRRPWHGVADPPALRH